MTDTTEQQLTLTPPQPLPGASEWSAGDPETDKALRALREPFPEEVIGVLPKGPRVPEDQRTTCPICGSHMGPHVHLNYVGWAAVVDRILSNDIRWTWDAYATDEDGLPKYRLSPNGKEVELWIRLSIAGVVRPGVGAVGKDEEDVTKKLISDALKNAASKFGIALDLWTKDELESLIGNQAVAARRARPPRGSTPTGGGRARGGSGTPRRVQADPAKAGTDGMSSPHRNKLIAHLARVEKLTSDGDQVRRVNALLVELKDENDIAALTDLTIAQGEKLFGKLGLS